MDEDTTLRFTDGTYTWVWRGFFDGIDWPNGKEEMAARLASRTRSAAGYALDRAPVECPALPGSRRWYMAPQRVGDVGLAMGAGSYFSERWMWLPQGLRWLEDDCLDETEDTESGDDLMAAIRDVARG